MMYVRYPLSLRNVEDLLAERGIDISHETVRFWSNRFGPIFAAEIRKRRIVRMRAFPQWRWHLDEVFVKVNGKLFYLWRKPVPWDEQTQARIRVKTESCACAGDRLKDRRHAKTTRRTTAVLKERALPDGSANG